MTTLASIEDFLILIIVALIPAIVYLAWVRKSERFNTEPWGGLLRAFFFGALFATLIAGALEVIIVSAGTSVSQKYPAPEFTFLNGNSPTGVFFLILVIAPLIEEALKASGVAGYRTRIRLVSDGLVFGAAVGLGFGFFETFLYGVGAFLTGGLLAGIAIIIVRSLSSVLLHGSTTALFGYGYAESTLNGRTGLAGAYYLIAVGMHAGFNALASLGAILQVLGFSTTIQTYGDLVGLILVFVYAFSAIEYARRVIQRTNFPGAGAAHPRYRPPPVKARIPPTQGR
jgi:RsiW-degrading membrane proteinase PrsW (M82 family)